MNKMVSSVRSPAWHVSLVLTLLSLCCASASAVIRCEMSGKPVNPSNGNDLVGLTGLLRCMQQDTGILQREQEMRNGKFIGIERFFDREGRLQRERVVNERGNSDGVAKEFWPSGQLRRQSNEINGSTQGAVRRYYENGQLESASFTTDKRLLTSLSFSKAGELTDISCHSASMLAEDRKPCGFEGKIQTTTFNYFRGGSKPGAIYTYEQGRLLATTTYREDGNVWAELAFQNGARWHRVFDTRGSKDGKNVLREERLYEIDTEGSYSLGAKGGRLQWIKLWGSNEQLTEHSRFSNGRALLTERWYLNGSLKEKLIMQGEGAQERVVHERYDDQGLLDTRENFIAHSTWGNLLTGLQQSYHANGTLAQQETYSAPDERGRTRLIARKQWDESGKLVADEEILEDGSRKRR
jgi:antitoxin component YwqK of YwqJK toxin-antitoxin module